MTWKKSDALYQQQAAVWRFQNQRELIPRTNKDVTKNQQEEDTVKSNFLRHIFYFNFPATKVPEQKDDCRCFAEGEERILIRTHSKFPHPLQIHHGCVFVWPSLNS